MKIEIADFEVVLINNIEEYKLVYPNLRSASSMTFDEWIKYFGEPKFPLYLEGINSVTRGYSIGFTTSPKPGSVVLTVENFKK